MMHGELRIISSPCPIFVLFHRHTNFLLALKRYRNKKSLPAGEALYFVSFTSTCPPNLFLIALNNFPRTYAAAAIGTA